MTYTLTKLADRKPNIATVGNSNIENDSEQSEYTLTKIGEKPGVAKQTLQGIAQGGLDVLSLGALATYPLERGVQLLTGQEDRPGLLPGQEARYSMQADILEKMQQPGYQPSFLDLLMLSDEDDIAPIGGSGTSLARLQQVQEEIPEEGIYQEGIRRVTRSLPFAALGPLGAILGAEFTGLAAREGVGALGGGETAQTIADIAGGLGFVLKNAFKRAPAASQVPFVAEKEGGLMQAIEKQSSPKVIEKRLLSLSDETIKDFGKKLSEISDKEIQQMSQFSAREIEDAIVKEGSNTILNKITPQDQLPQQAWKGIQESANALFEAEQNAYSPLYRNVRKSAEKITVNPQSSIASARSVLGKLTNVRTSPTGYTQTANLVRDVLHDLTGVSPSAELIKNALESGNTRLLDAIYDSLNKGSSLKADKLMDLSIRLNEAINYEALTPSVKDLLKPLQRTVKDELKNALKSNPESLKNLNDADELYKKTANRFGKDVIGSLRSTENPEKLVDVFSQPSNFENLVKLFGNNSQQVKNAERQIVEQLGKTNTKTANELFRNLEPYLSKNAKEASKEVIALGDKLSVPGQRRALQQAMLEDVSQAISTGQPPNFTTRAMMTPEGHQTAKQTFFRTQQGKELFKTLEKKIVSDLLDSVVVGDQINWQKAAEILENPNTSAVMNEILGNEGFAILKNLQNYGRYIASNINLAKMQQPTLFNKMINQLDSPTKLVLAAIVGKAIAAPLWLVGGAAAISLKNVLASVLTNKKALSAIRVLGNPSSVGSALLKETGILNSVIQDELS